MALCIRKWRITQIKITWIELLFIWVKIILCLFEVVVLQYSERTVWTIKHVKRLFQLGALHCIAVMHQALDNQGMHRTCALIWYWPCDTFYGPEGSRCSKISISLAFLGILDVFDFNFAKVNTVVIIVLAWLRTHILSQVSQFIS